jgi:hypothetical protein
MFYAGWVIVESDFNSNRIHLDGADGGTKESETTPNEITRRIYTQFLNALYKSSA